MLLHYVLSRTQWLAKTYFENNPMVAEQKPPQSDFEDAYVLTAALAELFAKRLNQFPPSWTSSVDPLKANLHLL